MGLEGRDVFEDGVHHFPRPASFTSMIPRPGAVSAFEYPDPILPIEPQMFASRILLVNPDYAHVAYVGIP